MSRRSARWRLSFVLAVVVVSGGGLGSVPTLARAAVPSAADKETARALFNEAKLLREAGQLGAALEKYRQAHVLARTPITGLELGRTYMMIGDLLEARDVLLAVDRIEVKADESPKSQAARQLAAVLAEELRGRIPTAELVLVNVPAAGRVQLTVDGVKVAVPSFGIPRKLNPGLHEAQARVGDLPPVIVEFSLAERESKVVVITFPTVQPERPAATPAPVSGASSEPQANPVEARSRPAHWMEHATIPALTVGGVALVTGIVTGIVATDAAAELRDRCQENLCPASQHSKLDGANVLASISTVSFGIGALGVGFGVWALLSSSGKPPPVQANTPTSATPIRWTAQVTPTSVFLSGSF